MKLIEACKKEAIASRLEAIASLSQISLLFCRKAREQISKEWKDFNPGRFFRIPTVFLDTHWDIYTHTHPRAHTSAHTHVHTLEKELHGARILYGSRCSLTLYVLMQIGP